MKRETDETSSHELDPPLDPALFDALDVPDVPPGFAARVVALSSVAALSAERKRKRRALMVACAAAASLAFWLITSRSTVDVGAGRAALRTTWSLGSRAVAVGEVGATLRWSIPKRGLAQVTQETGNVFYRVDKGHGGFEVHTPAGLVRVTGTCFRVEVTPMRETRTWLAAGAGAVAATTVLVGVYEGRVQFGNAQGAVEIAPGERAAADLQSAPRLTNRDFALGGTSTAAGGPNERGGSVPGSAPLSDGERRELVALRAKLATLETRGGTARPPGGAEHHEGNIVDPSHEELLERARSCMLEWDAPQLDAEPDETVDPKEFQHLNLSAEERETIGAIRKSFKETNLAELKRIYVEVTGNRAAADALSAAALQNEIAAKSPHGEAPEVFRRLSAEKAGLIPPSPSAANASALERMMRLVTSLGDRYEQALAAQLGAGRAHELRLENKGWASKSQSSYGCPGAPK